MKKLQNSNFKSKSDSNIKQINYDVSKLEKVMKISDNEIIAKAIRDILIRDKSL